MAQPVSHREIAEGRDHGTGGFHADLTASLRRYGFLQPGWDGEGTVPPKPEAVADAVAFVNLLSSDVARPEPMAAGDGEVGVYWRRGGAFIDVGFFGDGLICYYAEGTAQGTAIHGDIPFTGETIPEDLLAAIHALGD